MDPDVVKKQPPECCGHSASVHLVNGWCGRCDCAIGAIPQLVLAGPSPKAPRKSESRDAVREALRKRLLKYGMTVEEYEQKVSDQHGLCAICKQEPMMFVVDHDHSNGQVRGLLCQPCNSGLGLFRDDGRRVRRAALYLDEHRLRFEMTKSSIPESLDPSQGYISPLD